MMGCFPRVLVVCTVRSQTRVFYLRALPTLTRHFLENLMPRSP